MNEKYFIDLHKKTFESLYEFAGVYRDVNMTKGSSQFCLAQHLHAQSKRIFDELESEKYLSNIRDNKSLFAQRLAYYQGELIALHPFSSFPSLLRGNAYIFEPNFTCNPTLAGK